MTLKDILIAGKITISEGGGGGGASADALVLKQWPSGPITFSSATDITNENGFRNNDNITAVTGDSILTIGPNSFRYCRGIETIELSNCTRIGQSSANSQDSNSFDNCQNLKLVKLPKITNINGAYNFASCGKSDNKAVIVLPLISELGMRTFRSSHCSAVDLGPNLTQIKDDVFYGGSYDVVILRSSSVVPASKASAIEKLTTAGGCTIYVPSALISAYQSASIWADDTRTYAAIEGSQYETHYADGTAI